MNVFPLKLNQLRHFYATFRLKDYLPARYVLTFLTFWGMSLEYAHRVCLSVTIVAMVNQSAVANKNLNDTSNVDATCPASIAPDNDTSLYEMGEYDWSPSLQGVVLGSYFYGYVITQVAGGRLSELFGGKWTLGLAIFSGSLLTLATPVSADLGVSALVVIRVFMGLIHGLCLPSAYAMFSQWAPESERSTLVALCIIGDNIGTVVAMPLAGYLCDHGFAGGWPSVYYILGTLGIIWFLFWMCLVSSLPGNHPRISRQELLYIQDGRKNNSANQKLPVPWKSIFTSFPVWAIAMATFSGAWGYITLLTKLPTYLELVLHVPIQKNGFANSLIYVCTCVTLLFSGCASDKLRSRGFSPTTIRKSFQTIAMLGPAICLGLIPWVGCHSGSVIALLAAAMSFQGMAGGGHIAMAVDLAPHHAGTIFGLVNSMGSTAGIFSPLVAGLLLDSGHGNILEWSYVFYLSSIMYIVGYVGFMSGASANIQPWAIITVCEKTKGTEHSAIINLTKELEANIRYGSIS